MNKFIKFAQCYKISILATIFGGLLFFVVSAPFFCKYRADAEMLVIQKQNNWKIDDAYASAKSAERVSYILAHAIEMDMSVEKVRHIIEISQDTISVDTPIGENEDNNTLSDFIPASDDVLPNQAAGRKLLEDHVKDVLVTLAPREQKILKMRFGLEDGVTHTLEEIGKEFGVTRERIRQIEAKALDRIRDHQYLKKLEDY